MPRSWSFANDRRVIELAKASKSLEEAARIMKRKPERIRKSLTELERQFVERRLTEEQSNLESLATSLPDDFRGSKAGRPDSRLA